MTPLKYFPGHTLRAWKPWAWLTTWLVGLAFAVHVLLSDYGVSKARGNDHWKLLLAEGVVVGGAFLLWANFAWRPSRSEHHHTRHRTRPKHPSPPPNTAEASASSNSEPS